MAAGVVALLSVLYSVWASHGDRIVELVAGNQMMQALLATSGMCAFSAACWRIWQYVWAKVTAKMMSSITISNKDESFAKIIDFLAERVLPKTGALMAETAKQKRDRGWWKTQAFGARAAPKLSYKPANNNDIHSFKYAEHWIIMNRSKGQTITTGWNRKPMTLEHITLSTWGADNMPIQKLIDDAIQADFKMETEDLNVYVLGNDWWGGWEKALSKKPRALDSVILDEDLAEDLIADARDFLKSAAWYEEVGIPYRRGYLLHGPPGCGKTSFCQALAGELKLDICMLNLANKNLTDNSLAENLRLAPANAIVLLEDVDAIFVDRTAASSSKSDDGSGNSQGVTFSGLLNALDGVGAQEGRLFFATTNHLEKLDEALVRPGRCDVKVCLKKASRTQAAKLYERFYPNEAVMAQEFAACLPEYELSMAQLQGFLLEHKGNPSSALAQVPRLLRTSRPTNVDRMTVFEHLRRVGLEQWAPTLANYGYRFKADLQGLKVEDVKKWSGLLRLDKAAAARMNLLLTGDKILFEDYQFADMATVKEMFLSTFQQQHDVAAVAATATATTNANANAASLPTPASGDLRKPARSASVTDSDGMLRPVLYNNESTSDISLQSDAMCRAVQSDGKSVVSIWQLRRHLQLFADNAEKAVATAHQLIAPQPKLMPDVDDMSVYEWLRRSCMESVAEILEDAEFKKAADLHGRPLPEDLPGLTKGDRSLIEAVIKGEQTNPAAERGYCAPDRLRLHDDFYSRFVAVAASTTSTVSTATVDENEDSALAEIARRFADLLSDALGSGMISLTQLKTHLAKFRLGGGAHQAGACLHAVTDDIINHVRAPKVAQPAPPPPSEWVHGWLKTHNLEQHSSHFINAKLCTKEDVSAAPKLADSDLTDLGIKPLGDIRRLARLIQGL